MSNILGFKSLLSEENTLEYTRQWLIDHKEEYPLPGVRLRYRVLRDYDGKCALCGSRDAVEVDHIIPYSLRPDLALELDNLQPLCWACNSGKSNHCSIDWRKQ